MKMSAGAVEIVLCPTLSARPVHFQDCAHPTGCRMTVGYQGFKVEGRKGVLVADGIVCLDCGVDVTGTMWDDWGDPDLVSSISAVWQDFGWHPTIGVRALELSRMWLDEFVKAGFPVSNHQPVLPPPTMPARNG